jgi:hypothetical protein
VRKHILLAIILALLVSLQITYTDECEFTVTQGYPALPPIVQYPPECNITIGNSSITLYCPHNTVFSDHGLYIFVNSTQYNAVLVYALSDYIFLAIYDNPEVEKPLATHITCYELNCDISKYKMILEYWVYITNLNESHYYKCIYDPIWYIYGTNDTFTYNVKFYGFRLRFAPVEEFISPTPPPSPEEWTIPAWDDLGGWISFILRILSMLVSVLASTMYIIALMIYYFLQFSPYLMLIIPLHILFSFIHDPADGINAIKFYVELARKFYDMFIRLVHIIVDAIRG